MTGQQRYGQAPDVEPQCGNGDACGNTSVYRRPAPPPNLCRALAARINFVGLEPEGDCEGCGALVAFSVAEDSLSPNPPVADPRDACFYPEALSPRL